MKSIVGLATTSLALLIGAATAMPALAQQNREQLYAFHTSSIGGCPGLDWHVVVAPNRALSGIVAWDNMKHMATLNGTLEANGAFLIKAKEQGGAQRSATVKGTAAGDYINASIEGSGTQCDGKPLAIPRVVGGAGGNG